MHHFWQTLIIGLLTGGISAAVVGAILKYNIDKKLWADAQQRIQAAKIAELLTKWAKYGGKEKEILSKNELYDYYEELTKMSYELSLWLKNEELLKKILGRLVFQNNAPQPKELLIEIRKTILGKKSSKEIKANELVHWYVGDSDTR
jgi:hypothetical protein